MSAYGPPSRHARPPRLPMQLSLRMAHDRRILLRSLGALKHRVVARDLEGLAIRGVFNNGCVLGQHKKFSVAVDALEQLAAGRPHRLTIMIENPKTASRRSRARRIDGRPDPQP